MKQLPEHGMCFVCGDENPAGIGARWYVNEDGSIFGQVTLTERQQGPPAHAHGGATAALLDEAMGGAVWYAGHMAMSVNLSVNYRRPVPLGVALQVSGRLVRQEGRKLYAAGQIQLPDGSVAVEATGVYVEVQEMFGELTEQYRAYRKR